MKISGFTFARDVAKLGYPIRESIESILPICDEFVIALGDCQKDDKTEEVINSIGSDKIKIVHTKWGDRNVKGAKVYSEETNIALDNCSGDWCFYIQLDEVIHEDDLDEIVEVCKEYKDNPKVEGLLFQYRHLYGDYNHYFVNHKWYQREVRIVKNGIGVHSVGDAQSFKIGSNRKLNVIELKARVFHYGWVRHPKEMQSRNRVITKNYHGDKADKIYTRNQEFYDYGTLENIPILKESHPSIMKQRVNSFDWADYLQYSGKSKTPRVDERLKYRVLTFIEQFFFGGTGKQPWGYKPYRIIKG